MNKTYQPFIIEKADAILEILKDDVSPTDRARERLCMLLTEKFIAGNLSSEDEISSIFDSEEEILRYIALCQTDEDLLSLMEKGLVGVFEDENGEESFFVTEEGKRYMSTFGNFK